MTGVVVPPAPPPAARTRPDAGPASALYVGEVRHRRFEPVPHEFTYHVFQLYLDLAELDEVFRGRWLWSVERPNVAWFRRKDYLAPHDLPLDEAVRRRVEAELGRRPEGPIRLLTHLRYFGHGFDPVSFYYCFDRDERLDVVIAEITNTPWHERHAYVLGREHAVRDDDGKRREAAPLRFRFPKAFHVSPFMGMEQTLDWRFTRPGSRLTVHMENFEAERMLFDSTMTLERRPVTGASLAGALARHPLMTVKVVWGIHFQALRLWLKRVPVHDHPKHHAEAGR